VHNDSGQVLFEPVKLAVNAVTYPLCEPGTAFDVVIAMNLDLHKLSFFNCSRIAPRFSGDKLSLRHLLAVWETTLRLCCKPQHSSLIRVNLLAQAKPHKPSNNAAVHGLSN
jgi:hypothetical protein